MTALLDRQQKRLNVLCVKARLARLDPDWIQSWVNYVMRWEHHAVANADQTLEVFERGISIRMGAGR